jgi:hypothetical protein
MFSERHEEPRQIDCKKERNGQMFTLHVNMPEENSMLFTHGKRVGDIGI